MLPEFSRYAASGVVDMTTSIPYLTFSLNTQNGDWQNRSFMITERGFFDFMDKLHEVVQWFYDESMRDIFIRDSDNILVFNTAYKDLHVDIVESKKDPKLMRIMPTVDEGQEGTANRFEAVQLYINDLANLSIIRHYDLITMEAVLRKFSFQDEFIILLNALANATQRGAIFEAKPFSLTAKVSQTINPGKYSNNPFHLNER